MVVASPASLTLATGNARLHGYTITRSDTAHSTTNFSPTEIPQSHGAREGNDNPPLDTTPDDSWPRTLVTTLDEALMWEDWVHHWRFHYKVANAAVHEIMYLYNVMMYHK